MKENSKIIVLAYPAGMSTNELNRIIGETIELTKSNTRLAANEALVTIVGTDEINALAELSRDKSEVLVAFENILDLVAVKERGSKLWENRFWYCVVADLEHKGELFNRKLVDAFLNATRPEKAYFKQRGVPQIVTLMEEVKAMIS